MVSQELQLGLHQQTVVSEGNLGRTQAQYKQHSDLYNPFHHHGQ